MIPERHAYYSDVDNAQRRCARRRRTQTETGTFQHVRAELVDRILAGEIERDDFESAKLKPVGTLLAESAEERRYPPVRP